MKNITILIILLCCQNLRAQNWCPAGAAWHYSVNRGQTAGYQYWHYDRDTTVAGINCKIVTGTQYLTTTGVADTAIALLGPVYTYSANDTVYLFDTAFYPAYYFNAHAGDTIYTRNMGSLNLAVVDSNDTLIFSGDTLRYYLFHLLGSCADSNLQFKVIERIGGTGTSFVPAWNCADTASYNYALCNYADSAFALYPDSNTNCTYLSTPVVFTYHHLLEQANIWHYAHIFIADKPEWNTVTQEKSLSHCGDNTLRGFVFTNNDTMIGGYAYKGLAVKNSIYWIQGDSCLLGYIREDTMSGRVYFLDRDSAHEVLMYDFGMKVVDSIPVKFNGIGQSYFKSGTYTLDAIDSLTIADGVRKEFVLNCHRCNYSNPLIWIEGLGNQADIIYPNCMDDQYDGGLFGCTGYQHGFQQFVVCFEHDRKVYFDSCAHILAEIHGGPLTDSCNYDIFLGGGAVQKLTSLSSFTTYPNPTNNNVTVQLNVAESANFDVYVKDVDGKAVAGHLSLGRLNSGLHNAEMDVSNLSPGFYLVECRTTEGSLYSKLVVQR